MLTLEDTLPLFREGLDDILIQPIKPKTAVEIIRRLLPQAAGGARSTQSHFQSPDLPTAPTDPGDRRRLVVAKSASMLACLNQMEPLYLDTCTGLVRGPPGSEFELLARDLQAAWGTREHAVRVLRSPQLNPETFSALLENPTEPTRQVCFLPDIESCDETRQDAVLDFLRALRADRAARARLRVLFSTTAISGDSSASESDNLFVEELQFLVPTVVDLPPLHQRAADIPALAHAILTDLTRLFPTIRPRSLHPAAIDWLQREPWPGNYEELVGRLHRSMLQCERLELMPRDFQCYFERPAEGMPEIRLTTHLAL